MKTTLVLLSLLLAIYANFLFCSAAEAPEPVVVGGKMLRQGFLYYVLEADINGNVIGGGVDFGPATPSPVEVHEGSNGTSVSFSPVNSKKGVIRVSTDLNVGFWDTEIYDTTNLVWKLDRYDRATGQYFVSTGGVIGNPGRQTLRNWFKLEKYGNAYKFRYCPSVCQNCKVICRDVGVFVKDGQRLLALSDQPLLVTFIQPA